MNPMKMAKCIIELERIYEIRQGSAGKVTILESDNFTLNKIQKDFAKQLGISKQQLSDYKKLTNLIPELQTLILGGALKAMKI